MKVVILGKGEMLSNLIEGTLSSGCEISGILRYETTTIPKFILAILDFFKSSPEYTLIKKYKLHEINCKSANSDQFKREILHLNADVIIVGSWHEKLKKEIIDLPVIATINVHPSYLPKYRGPNPYLQTILHMEKASGITFHLMDKNFDTGAILAQEKINIMPNDTSKELKERTVYKARKMCESILKNLASGIIVPVPQNEKEATYFPNIKPEDMMLDFYKESAEEINARIRAFHPWMPCYYRYQKKYFIPNPYKLKILDKSQTKKILTKNNIQNPRLGEIINTNYKSRAITIMCKDNKSIKMVGTNLYGFFNKPLTSLFIKNINYNN